MTDAEKPKPGAGKRVGLFVTCLVDLLRPSVGFAAVKLLEDAGCTVIVPAQTCCGQPAYNSGDRVHAKAIARQTIAAFADCDHVVAPSGSCAGMLAKHYPGLFDDEPDMSLQAAAFAAKCRELTSFLVDTLGVTSVDAMSALFCVTIAFDSSPYLAAKAPPKPQQTSRSGRSTSLSPSTLASSLRG